MATHSTVWTGILSTASSSMSVGYAVVKNGDVYLPATSANRTSYGRATGIAITAADSTNRAFEIQVAGVVPNSITGLGTGSATWVIVSSTGTLERDDTPDSGEDIVGKCLATGDLVLSPGVWDSTNYTTAAGTVPTGTGFRHVTSGTEDGAAAKVDLTASADVTVPSAGVVTSDGSVLGSSATLVHEKGGLEADVSAYSGLVKISGGATSAVALGAGVETFLGTPSGANLASALTSALPISKGGTGATSVSSGLVKSNGSTFSSVTAPSGTVVGTTDTQTLTAKTYVAATTAMGALDVDWSTGNVFSKTLSAGGNTITFSNTSAGQVITVVLTSNGGGSTVTWPTVAWSGGAAPTQTSTGVDVYTFVKVGSTIYGSVVQDLS